MLFKTCVFPLAKSHTASGPGKRSTANRPESKKLIMGKCAVLCGILAGTGMSSRDSIAALQSFPLAYCTMSVLWNTCTDKNSLSFGSHFKASCKPVSLVRKTHKFKGCHTTVNSLFKVARKFLPLPMNKRCALPVSRTCCVCVKR